MSSPSATADALPSHDEVICTLFEGHYHFGFAVLLNSILRGGFSGLVWAGHRGPLPPWTSQLKAIGPGLFELPNGAKLQFEAMEPTAHFANYKPDFMLSLIHRGVAKKLLWYFDPDVTVRCAWKFFPKWASFGISICSDVINGSMLPNNPLRCLWVEAAAKAGWGEPTVQQTRYYNSGMVGLEIKHSGFLERWRDAISLAIHAGEGMDSTSFLAGTREGIFYLLDQDTMNLTIMYGDEPISGIGPEGMGFIAGGFTLYHSVGSPKPWRKEFFRRALRGIPPNNADKHFLECAEGPIHPFRASELKKKWQTVKIANLIGRFYSRN
jgi:hypothetical protein